MYKYRERERERGMYIICNPDSPPLLQPVGPHSVGNVTGLTLIDFIALPPNAKVACTYLGEDGAEGFLGLRKM